MQITFGRLQVRNKLLRAMSQTSFDALQGDLEAVDLPVRFRLSEANQVPDWVYFPDGGVASVIGNMHGTWQEVGLFGNEGCGCMRTLLGGEAAPYLIVMQVAGKGYRLPAPVLRTFFKSHPDVQEILLKYVSNSLVQISQSAMANTQFNTEQRLARWLLMIHDRIEGDAVRLTHEYLSAMLGVGRTGVTLALQALTKTDSILMRRGQIIIKDRSVLEKMTAPLYGFAEVHYSRTVETGGLASGI